MSTLRHGTAQDIPYTEKYCIINGVKVLIKVYRGPTDKLNKINEGERAPNANN